MAVKDGLPATDFSRMNREYIKAVAEGGSGGGGLPEITEADEGKFLGVVSGEAAWATAGGGGGGTAVECTVTEEETYDEYEIQMPAGELLTACMNGPVIIYIQAGENKYAITILRASYSAIQGGYKFTVLFGEDAANLLSFTSSDVNEKPIYRDTY